MSNLRAGNFRAFAFELAVVALGIFFGLQADQWYEDRQDQNRRDEYLERLHANVNADIGSLNEGIEVTRGRLLMADMLYSSVSDPSIAAENPSEYLRALQQVTFKFGTGSSARDATFLELTNTGDMRLIPISVRDNIYEYYRVVADREYAMDGADTIQSESNRRFAGLIIMGDLETALALDSPNNEPAALKSRALAAAERFRNNKEAIEWLPKLAEWHRIEIAQTRRRIGFAQELVLALEEYLGD